MGRGSLLISCMIHSWRPVTKFILMERRDCLRLFILESKERKQQEVTLSWGRSQSWACKVPTRRMESLCSSTTIQAGQLSTSKKWLPCTKSSKVKTINSNRSIKTSKTTLVKRNLISFSLKTNKQQNHSSLSSRLATFRWRRQEWTGVPQCAPSQCSKTNQWVTTLSHLRYSSKGIGP